MDTYQSYYCLGEDDTDVDDTDEMVDMIDMNDMTDADEVADSDPGFYMRHFRVTTGMFCLDISAVSAFMAAHQFAELREDRTDMRIVELSFGVETKKVFRVAWVSGWPRWVTSYS